MKIKKTMVALEAAELIDLQAILLDEDEHAALEFLKHLKKKIEVQERQQCGSPLVKGESA